MGGIQSVFGDMDKKKKSCTRWRKLLLYGGSGRGDQVNGRQPYPQIYLERLIPWLKSMAFCIGWTIIQMNSYIKVLNTENKTNRGKGSTNVLLASVTSLSLFSPFSLREGGDLYITKNIWRIKCHYEFQLNLR